MSELRAVIENFLQHSRQPVALDPGDDPIPILPGSFQIGSRGPLVLLEVWNETRNLVRRIRRIHSERRSRLELEVEHFGGKSGRLTLIDLAHPASRGADRRGARLKYRERFRRSLRRQFGGWRLAELSAEADLHHSLSPAYPRAFLRRGSIGLAAIGAPKDAPAPEAALTFGLIWLDYLRRREPRTAIQGLAIFMPEGTEPATCHRIRYLDPEHAAYAVFVHRPDGSEDPVDPRDYTNFDTRIEPCRQPLAGCPAELAQWVARLAAIEGVDRRDHPDGSVSLAVNGLEFARASCGSLLFGLDRKHPAHHGNLPEVEALARELARMRRAGAAGPGHPLYTQRPEAWLESQIRNNVERIDAGLLQQAVYGQVPAFAAGERGVLDILAADRHGQIAVIEVKISQDVHLPLQALDYWMRVKWHLERGEFSGQGYFPGIELRAVPPRLFLVAPALDFHPSNEAVLRFFSPEIPVERVGIGIEWRQELRVMFRSSVKRCLLQSSAKSGKLSLI